MSRETAKVSIAYLCIKVKFEWMFVDHNLGNASINCLKGNSSIVHGINHLNMVEIILFPTIYAYSIPIEVIFIV